MTFIVILAGLVVILLAALTSFVIGFGEVLRRGSAAGALAMLFGAVIAFFPIVAISVGFDSLNLFAEALAGGHYLVFPEPPSIRE